MATRIVNKLYGCFGDLLASKSHVYKQFTRIVFKVENTIEYVPDPVKRPTKNLESLIKALNKQGYSVSVSQIYSHDEYKWFAYIHDTKRESAVIGINKSACKTAYQALKAAIPEYGWQQLEV
jgi:hypothetical protein